MTKKTYISFALLLLSVCLSSASYALPTGGIAVITGHTDFDTGDNYLPQQISAHLDYQVLNYPEREVGGNYLYTYRIFNLDSTDPITFFSVGLRNGTDPRSPAYEAAVDDIRPSAQQLVGSPPRSVNFQFYDNTDVLDTAKHSALLYFVSDYAPSMRFGTLSGAGISTVGALPSPIPEPTILSLFGAAAAMRLWRKTNKMSPLKLNMGSAKSLISK